MTDRDDHRRGAVAGGALAGLDEGAQQAERLEVDSCELESGPLRDVDVRRDLVARSDDQQDPSRRLARLERRSSSTR